MKGYWKILNRFEEGQPLYHGDLLQAIPGHRQNDQRRCVEFLLRHGLIVEDERGRYWRHRAPALGLLERVRVRIADWICSKFGHKITVPSGPTYTVHCGRCGQV